MRKYSLLALAVAGAALAGLLFTTPAAAQGTLNLDEAINSTRLMLDGDSHNRDLRIRLVKLHFIEGARHLERGNAQGAIGSLANGLRVAEAGQVSDSEEVIQFTNYALAHATEDQDRTQEVISILDGLVAAAPRFHLARYMLGYTLMRSSSSADFARGSEVMRQLWLDSSGGMRSQTSHAAANLAYERAIADSNSGRTGAALDILQQVQSDYGNDPYNTGQQNQNFHFALGTLMDQTGNSEGTVQEYQAVYNQNSNYSAGGLSIGDALANASYRRALEHITQGGVGAGQAAVALLDQVERIEGRPSVDVHHGRYLAYRMTGDMRSANAEVEAIRTLDRSYYDSLLRNI